MSFFGSIGDAAKGLAKTAVGMSPYVARVMAERKAADEADRQRMLQQLYASNADTRAQQGTDLAQEMGATNMAHINAETAALKNPAVSVKYMPNADNQMVGLPTKVRSGDTPAPITTGVSAPPRPAPKIDPNSQAGIDAAGKKAEATAGARAKYAQPKTTPMLKTQTPGGPVVYTPQSQAAGMQAPVAAGGMGGQSLSPEDRAKMLAQAKLDNATMKAYENKVLASGKVPGTIAGLAGASADAHGSVVNNMIGILGNKATGSVDPEYQRYITAQRSYGRIMGNLQSKRYTDHQAEIERSISGLQGNDLSGTISYKQSLRDASLADPAVAPAQSGNINLSNAPAAPTTTPKKPAKDYGAFGKPPGGDE